MTKNTSIDPNALVFIEGLAKIISYLSTYTNTPRTQVSIGQIKQGLDDLTGAYNNHKNGFSKDVKNQLTPDYETIINWTTSQNQANGLIPQSLLDATNNIKSTLYTAGLMPDVDGIWRRILWLSARQLSEMTNSTQIAPALANFNNQMSNISSSLQNANGFESSFSDLKTFGSSNKPWLNFKNDLQTLMNILNPNPSSQKGAA